MLRFLLLALLASLALSLPTNHKDGARESSELDPHESFHSGERGGGIADSLAEASSLSDVELVAGDDDSDEGVEDGEEDDPKAAGQHFFPSFAPFVSNNPPLGHSRPHGYDGSGATRPLDFPFKFSNQYNQEERRYPSAGNFGVIRGGTYYSNNADENDEFEGTYYRGSNNGHGRPHFFHGNPQPAYRQGGDFFAGFRDFADITTPAKPAYSQYFVVYANRNSTSQEHDGPKNIFDQLALLDKPDKLSKTKKKLNIYKDKQSQVEYMKKNRSPKEGYEPLLALS